MVSMEEYLKAKEVLNATLQFGIAAEQEGVPKESKDIIAHNNLVLTEIFMRDYLLGQELFEPENNNFHTGYRIIDVDE